MPLVVGELTGAVVVGVALLVCCYLNGLRLCSYYADARRKERGAKALLQPEGPRSNAYLRSGKVYDEATATAAAAAGGGGADRAGAARPTGPKAAPPEDGGLSAETAAVDDGGGDVGDSVARHPRPSDGVSTRLSMAAKGLGSALKGAARRSSAGPAKISPGGGPGGGGGGVPAVSADGVELDEFSAGAEADADEGGYGSDAAPDAGGKQAAGAAAATAAAASAAASAASSAAAEGGGVPLLPGPAKRTSRFSFLGGARPSSTGEQTPEQLAAAAERKRKADALIEKKRLEKVKQDAARQLKAALGQITPKKLDALATDEAEAVLEGADGVLAIATEAKVEWAKIVELRTSITSARERTQERRRDAVREMIREDLVLIDMYAAGDGAKTLIEQIYLKHPPKRRTVADEEIGRAKTDAHWKKILLKAQRDFHPDRNQGREHVPTFESTGALKYGVLEWQMLSNAICQRLTIKFDKMFKTMEAVLE